MPTIEQLGAKIGDRVMLPVSDGKHTKWHTLTIVGILPTRTFVDPPIGEYNLAVLNATGRIRDLYQKAPNEGYRNGQGESVITGEGYFRVPPDLDKGERYVQHIHSGYAAYLPVLEKS